MSGKGDATLRTSFVVLGAIRRQNAGYDSPHLAVAAAAFVIWRRARPTLPGFRLSLQELRGQDLIRLKGRKLTIPDLNRLMLASRYSPSYLQLDKVGEVDL